MGTFEQARRDPTLGLPERLGEHELDNLLATDALAATAQHIELLNRKINALQDARVNAWNQLLTSAGRLFVDGELTERSVLDLYYAMSRSYGTGYTRVWDRNMPVESCRVSAWPRRWKAQAQAQERSRPNGPMGSWVGVLPLPLDASTPDKGVAVVYVLFDVTNEPVYVGSTGNLRVRLSSHLREKPEACQWTAYKCRDREHAYAVETRLLDEYKPRLNKQGGSGSPSDQRVA